MLTEERYTQPAGDMPDFGSEERLRLGTQIWKRAHRESCPGGDPSAKEQALGRLGRVWGMRRQRGARCAQKPGKMFSGDSGQWW